MTLSRTAFERAVRRLDGDDARRLVAGLLDARGHRTSIDGPVVTATRGRRGASESGAGNVGDPAEATDSTRFLIVDGLRTVVAGGTGLGRGIDVVVITGGPVAGAAGAALGPAGRGGPGGPTVLDPGTLYEWFAYGIDAESRAALAEAYLDATDPSAFERGRSALVDALGGASVRPGRLSTPSGRAAGAGLIGLLALLALVAATVGPGLLASTGQTAGGVGGTSTPQLTPAPAAITSVPRTTDPGLVLPESCPKPPLDAHPASLRPGVIRTASADGLEGWRLLVTQNITEYDFDPNDQQLGPVPEVRHVAVFETQAGAQLRLGLDRWESPDRAGAAIARGGSWSLGIPWGTYGAWVEWQSEDGRRESAARELLAAVRTPGGVGLGGECVSALLTANGTA